jgi:hypothetical protein
MLKIDSYLDVRVTPRHGALKPRSHALHIHSPVESPLAVHYSSPIHQLRSLPRENIFTASTLSQLFYYGVSLGWFGSSARLGGRTSPLGCWLRLQHWIITPFIMPIMLNQAIRHTLRSAYISPQAVDIFGVLRLFVNSRPYACRPKTSIFMHPPFVMCQLRFDTKHS